MVSFKNILRQKASVVISVGALVAASLVGFAAPASAAVKVAPSTVTAIATTAGSGAVSYSFTLVGTEQNYQAVLDTTGTCANAVANSTTGVFFLSSGEIAGGPGSTYTRTNGVLTGTPGISYYVCVRTVAWDGANFTLSSTDTSSAWVPSANAVVAYSPPAIQVPTNLAVTSVAGTMTLTWTGTGNSLHGYQPDYSFDAGTTWANYNGLSNQGASTMQIVSGAFQNGVTVSVRIRTAGMQGNSAWSSSVSHTIGSVNNNSAPAPVTYKVKNKTTRNGVTATTESTVFGGTAKQTHIVRAPEGYLIDVVKVNGKAVTLTDGAYTFTNVDQDQDLDVTYVADPNYNPVKKISVSAGPNGFVSSNLIYVGQRNSATLAVAPAKGYRVDTFTVNGVSVSLTNNAYRFENVLADHNVLVTFVADAAAVAPTAPTGNKITATAGANGFAGLSSSLVANGGIVSFAAVALAGYKVDKFTIDGVAAVLSNGVYSMTNVTKDHDFAVTFVKSTD